MKKHSGKISIVVIVVLVISIIVLTIISEAGIINVENNGTLSETDESTVETTEAEAPVTEAPVTETPVTEATINPEDFYIEEPAYTDYSDFGFENMYGMNTWLEIYGYHFSSDSEGSYVCVSKSGDYPTLYFNNNFLKQVLWNRFDEGNVLYDENDSSASGLVYDTVNFGIVDNDTISFVSGYYSGSTFYITERKMTHGIPILVCEFNSTSRHAVYDDGWYMPTGFIDWSKSPETGTYINKEGTEIEVIKYYLDENYIQD